MGDCYSPFHFGAALLPSHSKTPRLAKFSRADESGSYQTTRSSSIVLELSRQKPSNPPHALLLRCLHLPLSVPRIRRFPVRDKQDPYSCQEQSHDRNLPKRLRHFLSYVSPASSPTVTPGLQNSKEEPSDKGAPGDIGFRKILFSPCGCCCCFLELGESSRDRLRSP